MKFETALNTSKEKIKKCFICGSNVEYLGIFIPDDPAEFNQLNKNNPGFFYGLCDKCYKKDDKEKLVEEKILKEAKND